MEQGSKKQSSRHWLLKEKVRAFRAQGLSYREILEKVKVSKSSVSLWCRDVPLTEEQKKRLQEKRPQSAPAIAAVQAYYWEKRCNAFSTGRELTQKFYHDPLFCGGLMLYWAEGSKANSCAEVTNSDPRVIRFMVEWFRRFLERSPETLRIHMHLHSGQSEGDVKRYWSGITGVPLANFQKSFIKPEGSGYRKNILYNGTIKLRIAGASRYALYTILGSIAQYLEMTLGYTSSVKDWTDRIPYAHRAASSIGRANPS